MTSWLSTSWLLPLGALTLLGVLAACIRFLFHESRRTLALDRRLQATRALALSAYGSGEGALEDNIPSRSWSMLSVVTTGGVRVASLLMPIGAEERAKIAALIQNAGFKQRDAVAVFLSVKLVLTLTSGVVAGLLASRMELLGGHAFVLVMAGIAGAVLGGLLPEAVMRRLVVRRRLSLSQSLPDALDLMVLSVEAGHTFERALYMVSQELQPMAPDLAGELASAEVELRLGADRRGVLNDLYERTGVEGLRDFAMTVIQAERYGTPIGQSIQNIAESERSQRAARIEAAAGRLPVLMSLPMLLFVVPGILLLLGGPAFLTAMQALKGLSGN